MPLYNPPEIKQGSLKARMAMFEQQAAGGSTAYNNDDQTASNAATNYVDDSANYVDYTATQQQPQVEYYYDDQAQMYYYYDEQQGQYVYYQPEETVAQAEPVVEQEVQQQASNLPEFARLKLKSTNSSSNGNNYQQQPSYQQQQPPKPTPLRATSKQKSGSYGSFGERLNLYSSQSDPYSQTYPQFRQSELDLFSAQFSQMDKDGDGYIDRNELAMVCREVGMPIQNDSELDQRMREVDLNNNGRIEFDEFVQMASKIRSGSVQAAETGFSQVYQKQSKLFTISGADDSTQHSINEDELEQFSLHINQVLQDDRDLVGKLPLDTRSFTDLFEKSKDGWLLCKLINASVADTIDERVLNKGAKLNAFQKSENNNLVVNSAKAIGCSVVNIGAQDIAEGRAHLVLGLVWQIIKIGLFAKVDLQYHPELFRLLEDDEELDDLFKLPVDQILMRWFNYHLRKAGWHRQISNFGSDLRDSENYTVLLEQLVPSACSRDPMMEDDLMTRAELMLQGADRLGCRYYVTPKSIVRSNQKLNTAFIANLFNLYPGLDPLDDNERSKLDDWLFSSQGDREARAFALWLNSLGVDTVVNNLYEDLKDGLVMLQAFDKIHRGSVTWSRVNRKRPVGKFKMVENTNLLVQLGKQVGYSLVGIQGADITDGNKKLTLSIVWQLMRDNITQILKSLSRDGRDVSDDDIINWANSVPARIGRDTYMQSFKDPNLGNSVFFLDLLAGIKKNSVDYSLITAGQTEEDAKMNAKLAISVARKLGATIFVLPEDLMEVKPKLVLTFVGALMAVDRMRNPQLN